MAFQCDVSQNDGVTVAKLIGDIDGSTASIAQDHLLPLIQPGVRVVLDMTGVGYMSSAGLRTLLLVYRQASAANGRVALAGLAEGVRDTMSITGFLGFFIVCADLTEALAAMGGD